MTVLEVLVSWAARADMGRTCGHLRHHCPFRCPPLIVLSLAPHGYPPLACSVVTAALEVLVSWAARVDAGGLVVIFVVLVLFAVTSSTRLFVMIAHRSRELELLSSVGETEVALRGWPRRSQPPSRKHSSPRSCSTMVEAHRGPPSHQSRELVNRSGSGPLVPASKSTSNEATASKSSASSIEVL